MNRIIFHFTFLVVITGCTTKATAQYTYDWAKKLSGAHTDWAYDIAVDNDGNVISSGSFAIATDFDPSVEGVAEMTSADNDGHAYISKLDADGNYVWARSLSGKSSGRSVVTDQDGNVYAGGSFSGSFDFDNGVGEISLSSNGQNDAFIAKYAPNGDLLWAKSFGGQNHDGIVRMAINENGDIAVCGYFVYTVDFDPGVGVSELTAIENAQTNDVFVSVFDTDGNFQWVHQMGSSNSQSPNDIALDSQGNVLITGQFAGAMNCDPGITDFTFESDGTNWWEVFVVKLSNSGEFIWGKRFGGPDLDVGYGIAVDPNDNVLVTGHFGLTADLDPGVGVAEFTVSGGWYDIFILKLNSEGNFIWARQMASLENDYGADIAVDGGGNIYTTGYSSGDCDLDPGPEVAEVEWEGGSDIFISVLNADGEYLWGENFGSFEDDWGNAIVVDDSHIYVTGLFRSFANFGDFNINSEGNEDAFVFKLTHPPFTNVHEDNIIGFSLFPNPANDNLYIRLNEFMINKINEMSIMDHTGKLVWSSNQFSKNMSIDVSELSEGFYLILLHNSDHTTSQPFVVVH